MVRAQVRTACQSCQKKRTKCNGIAPCEKCKAANQNCVFKQRLHSTKADLRAEIQHLKEANDQRSALFNTLCTLNEIEAYQMVSRWVIGDRKAGGVGLEELIERARVEGELYIAKRSAIPSLPSLHCLSKSDSASVAASLQSGMANCPHSIHGLPNVSHQPLLDGNRRDRLDTGLPIFRRSASAHFILEKCIQSREYIHQEGDIGMTQIDSWCWTGWTTWKIHGLLDEFLSQEFLPQSLMCKSNFLEDHSRGCGLYCSSALVNALLALAAYTIDGTGPQGQSEDALGKEMPSLPFLSEAFYDEAFCLIYRDDYPNKLPDIQALGMLALYKVNCGDMPGALEMAEGFSQAATTLCLQQPHTANDDQFCRVQAMTYCGAITLVRMLRLTTLPHLSLMQDDCVTLEQSPGDSEPLVDAPPGEPQQSSCDNFSVIAAKLFQLTEWVYKFLAKSEFGEVIAVPENTARLMALYKACLVWYKAVISFLRQDDPVASFVHTYFQFGIMRLFRPFASSASTGLQIDPRATCLEAAQSIINLSKTHAVTGAGRCAILVPHIMYEARLMIVTGEVEGGRRRLGADAIGQERAMKA